MRDLEGRFILLQRGLSCHCDATSQQKAIPDDLRLRFDAVAGASACLLATPASPLLPLSDMQRKVKTVKASRGVKENEQDALNRLDASLVREAFGSMRRRAAQDGASQPAP